MNHSWFGVADADYTKALINHYSKLLKLNAGRAPNSRAPLEFIGRLTRSVVAPNERYPDQLRVSGIMPPTSIVFCCCCCFLFFCSSFIQ